MFPNIQAKDWSPNFVNKTLNVELEENARACLQHEHLEKIAGTQPAW
jgi:hypothetical protein